MELKEHQEYKNELKEINQRFPVISKEINLLFQDWITELTVSNDVKVKSSFKVVNKEVKKDKLYINYTINSNSLFMIEINFQNNPILVELKSNFDVSESQLDAINSCFEEFQKQALYFKNNKELLKEKYEQWLLLNQEREELSEKVKELNVLCGLSKNRKVIKKACSLFPKVKDTNLQEIITKKILGADINERDEFNKNGLKIQFMQYVIRQDHMLFKTVSFRAFKENDSYRFLNCQSNQPMTEKEVEYMLNQRFYFRGQIVENKSHLNDLKIQGKGRIEYSRLFELLEKEMIQLNVSNF